MEPRSLLDTLGSDIIGVMSPVSICMFLVVLLVSTLFSPTSSNSVAVATAATLVYQESSSDPTSEKLEGALLNAAAFVALITGVTFFLLLLYYYNFTNFLKYYMCFSAFFILASMGGSISASILRRFAVPLDFFTFGLLLFNFAVVGIFTVISSTGFPIVLRQMYMVSLGIVVAVWFTKLPEWTTWTVLMALAVYDLVAVLAPGGPLKMLVELASNRGEELPAFVYEARPALPPSPSSIELQQMPPTVRNPIEVVTSTSNSVAESETMPLVRNADATINERERDETVQVLEAEEEEEEIDTTRGIRLGLGDFVFYSVLVGRAALYDWMTVYACYLAIVSGLGCTLILLSVYRKALPALPISIMLGIGFYFLTRLLLEPFVVGASCNLVMF